MLKRQLRWLALAFVMVLGLGGQAHAQTAAAAGNYNFTFAIGGSGTLSGVLTVGSNGVISAATGSGSGFSGAQSNYNAVRSACSRGARSAPITSSSRAPGPI